MLIKTCLLTAALLANFVMAPGAAPEPTAADATVWSLQDNTTEITGALGAYVLASDGFTYFMLGDVLLRMPTKNFPDPIPEFGTKLKATGCTPDTDGTADYVCTGLS